MKPADDDRLKCASCRKAKPDVARRRMVLIDLTCPAFTSGLIRGERYQPFCDFCAAFVNADRHSAYRVCDAGPAIEVVDPALAVHLAIGETFHVGIEEVNGEG